MSTWTARDIPDLSGLTAVVTGANTGLGKETARELARRGAVVEMAVRDEARGRAAADEVRADVPGADLRVQRLDVASLASVRAAAEELRGRHERIDLLVNNAGVMYTPRSTTEDGFELQLGTNHLGHVALTALLLDRLLAAPAARVVAVSSVAHKVRSRIDFDDLAFEHGYDRVAAYGRSKLANLLFAYRLDALLRAAGAPAVALAAHPGVSDTELTRHSPGPLRLGARLGGRFLNSAAVGALATLRAATDPDARGGEFYGPRGPGEAVGHPVRVLSTDASHDGATQRRLWDVSCELTGVSFDL